MSTPESAIEIDDDEESLGDTKLKADSELFLSSVNQVCTILCVPESVARQALNAFDYDVERAIHHLLSMPSKFAATTALTVPMTTTTSNRSNNNKPATAVLQGLDNCVKKQKPQVAVVDPEQGELTATGSSAAVLSREWQDCYQQCNGLFVDFDFPPCDHSLDGRERDTTTTTNGPSTTTKVKKCACGLPAAARTVQSEGPNYGRFYLICGKQRQQQGPRCQYFQWDPKGTLGVASAAEGGYDSILRGGRGRRVDWTRFGSCNGCVMVKKENNSLKIDIDNNTAQRQSTVFFSPSHVRQGRVGNCWFLSALAVVAERPDLMQRIVPQLELNSKGCYQINLCLDGKWTPVIIDSNLPVIVVDEEAVMEAGGGTAKTTSRKRKHLDNKMLLNQAVPFVSVSSPSSSSATTSISSSSSSPFVAFTAFAATPSRQLWPALVEKAYAKAHGSYAHLSGGWIAEALQDLTGAPTETILLGASSSSSTDSKDLLWVRMLSFAQAGFLMGVATAMGGNGLVGGHAYSILDVVEINDIVVGEQCKVTEFFSKKEKKKAAKEDDTDNNATTTNSTTQLSATTGSSTSTSAGKSKGAAVDSFTGSPLSLSSPSSKHRSVRGERATIRLVRIRNPWGIREWKGAWSADADQWTKALRKRLKESWSKGDGTFFMSFEDMLERFHHLDVAKARKGWVFESVDGLFLSGGHSDALGSSKTAYRLRPCERTWAFLSVIQPKKRANTTSRYFYCDPSFLLLKQKHGEVEWACEAAIFSGVQRTSTCEVFLDPAFSYVCIPFSSLASSSGGPFAFRLTCYSASQVDMKQEAEYCRRFSETAVAMFHKELLREDHKLLYPVAKRCMLACVHGDGCIYFIAINGTADAYLSLKLIIEDGTGMLTLLGRCDDTHDVPPRSQKLLVIISRNGKANASASSLKFRYMSAAPIASQKLNYGRQLPRVSFASTIPISLAGDLLSSNVDTSQVRDRGCDVVDTYLWIPQIGAM